MHTSFRKLFRRNLSPLHFWTSISSSSLDSLLIWVELHIGCPGSTSGISVVTISTKHNNNVRLQQAIICKPYGIPILCHFLLIRITDWFWICNNISDTNRYIWLCYPSFWFFTIALVLSFLADLSTGGIQQTCTQSFTLVVWELTISCKKIFYQSGMSC